MAMIFESLYKSYNLLFYEIADPRTKDYFLMNSPIPGIMLLVFYNFFVMKIGPQLMKNVKPFNLKTTIFCYNIAQIVTCSYVFYKGTELGYGWNGKFSLLCEPINWEDTPFTREIINVIWVYMMTKVADLLDTVFFVLRKKSAQVSFLHLYHHTGMVMLSWSCMKWLAGGHSLLIGYVNSLVHIFMYTYYTLALLDSKKYNWMKKYITQLQMIQFLINIVHCSLLIVPSCTYPKWTMMVLIPQNTFMLFLFADFYRKEYLKPKRLHNGYNKQN